MRRNSVLLVLIGILIIASPALVRADGKYGEDVTVKGTVVEAVVDDASGKVYVLEPESANEPLPAIVKSGAKVTVYGDSMEKNGHAAIRAESVK